MKYIITDTKKSKKAFIKRYKKETGVKLTNEQFKLFRISGGLESCFVADMIITKDITWEKLNRQIVDSIWKTDEEWATFGGDNLINVVIEPAFKGGKYPCLLERPPWEMIDDLSTKVITHTIREKRGIARLVKVW